MHWWTPSATSSSRKPRRPIEPGAAALLLLCLMVLAIALHGRLLGPEPLQPVDSSPENLWVQVEINGKASKNFRFSSPPSLATVINMTTGYPLSPTLDQYYGKQPAVTGMRLKCTLSEEVISYISIGWMPASQRIALRVPLHPDRMTELDWQALPRLGPALASRIEKNRQKYGDFGCFEELKRVDGIGPKTISGWRGFFSPCEVIEN